MNFLDFEDTDLADQILEAIEKDYGRGIARIPFFERTGAHTFELKVIFADFKLLEATIMVVPYYIDGLSTIRVEGIYL
jgi:hypothetical protein